MNKIVLYLVVIFSFLFIVRGNPCDGDKHLQQRDWNELQDSLKSITNELTAQSLKIKALESNPVPIGFIYVQLPDQPEPHNLWQTVIFTDITLDYKGLFFRVFGNNSEHFGVIQEENSPRIQKVHTVQLKPHNYTIEVPANGVWSGAVSSGANVAADTMTWGLTFIQSGGEVRPRNTAIRIWKRVR